MNWILRAQAEQERRERAYWHSEAGQAERKHFFDAIVQAMACRLLLDARERYPDDDDMTFARREKALIIESLGEKKYQQWTATNYGQQHQQMWGDIIQRLGELPS